MPDASSAGFIGYFDSPHMRGYAPLRKNLRLELYHERYHFEGVLLDQLLCLAY